MKAVPLVASGLLICFLTNIPAAQPARFDVVETTIPGLADAMNTGRGTSKALAQAYLVRIEAYDRRGPEINALISRHPKALDEADALRHRCDLRVRAGDAPPPAAAVRAAVMLM